MGGARVHSTPYVPVRPLADVANDTDGCSDGRLGWISPPRRRTADGHARRILIIGINYAPEPIGIGPYTAGLAEHLTASGYGVTVVAGMPSYPEWRVFSAYRGRWRLQEPRDGVQVRRLRHYVPTRASALQRGLYEGSFFVHGLTALALPQHDTVIGVVPSLSGGTLARLVAQRHGVPYGLVFQDLIGPASAQSGTQGGSRVTALTGAAERWTARKAAGVAAVSAGFFPYLTRAGVPPERLFHLPNWVHVAEPTADRAATRARLGWLPDQQIVLHAGNMGMKQGLEQVIEAARIAISTNARTRFVLLGDGNQRRNLERRAVGLLNCTFVDPVAFDHFPNMLAAADALLVSERASLRDMCLPSKLISYFAAGRPVVAVTPANSGTAAELRRAGAGIAVPPGRPGVLLLALAHLAGDAALRDRLGHAGSIYARDYLSAPAALARCSTFVERLLSARSPRLLGNSTAMAAR